MDRIAKDAEVTWETVQHQFGDLDGVWVAVITEIHSRSWNSIPDTWPAGAPPLRERVDTVIDSVWNYLDTTEGRAPTALRTSLGFTSDLEIARATLADAVVALLA